MKTVRTPDLFTKAGWAWHTTIYCRGLPSVMTIFWYIVNTCIVENNEKLLTVKLRLRSQIVGRPLLHKPSKCAQSTENRSPWRDGTRQYMDI